jgi:HAMP domain-containing protein
MPKRPRLRRRILVEPGFQLALGGAIVFLLLAYGAIVVFSVIYPISEFMDLLPATALDGEIKGRILAAPYPVWPVILVIVLVAGLQAVALSHRVAGPTFRLRRAIREMRAGRYRQPLTLRKHDYLKEVADGLAHLGDSLHRRREALLSGLAGLRVELEQHRELLRQGEAASTSQHDITRILQQIETLEQIAQGTAHPDD